MKQSVRPKLFFIKNIFILSSVLFLLLFSACQQTTEAEDKAAYQAASVIAPENEKAPVLETKEENVPEPVYYPTNPAILKSVVVPNDENLTKTAWTIREQFIDSLNKVVPVYDKAKYNKVSVTYFTSLAHSLGGRTYFADHADSLSGSIMEILSSRLDDGTDIVFLIDKTGSMDDDLEKVKSSMGMIMDYLSSFENVKLGIASYGDKNYQSDFWYNRMDLSTDVNHLRSYMESYSTIGNPDVPESVNDAIVKTVREMNWTEGNKRLMLVIGDAPSQQAPLSSYSEKDVIAVCDSMNVKFNLYPIIISASLYAQMDTPFRGDFVKTYPNPVNQFMNADFDSEEMYYYELNDINGKRVLINTVSQKNAVIDMSAVNNGVYLLQIYNQKADKYYSSKLVIQH
jgi:hypothetical protein